MHIGMQMILFIFYEASRFDEKVMHEVMHAMHVGMQASDWIFL